MYRLGRKFHRRSYWHATFFAILAMFLVKEVVGWRTLAAVFLAFLGVLVIGFDPLVLKQEA